MHPGDLRRARGAFPWPTSKPGLKSAPALIRERAHKRQSPRQRRMIPVTEDSNDLSVMGRRAFMLSAAVATAAPILTEATMAQAKLRSQGRGTLPPDAVIINANENPLGPSKAACDAIANIAPMGGRYDRMGVQETFIKTYAANHGLKPENIAVYAGSSEPL